MPASGPRGAARPGAGPGRGPRTGSGPRRPAPRQPATTEPSRGEHATDEPPLADRRRRSSLTSRAIALAVVFLILTISYATSLRIYFTQSAEIAATRAEISQRQQRITDLQSDLGRWQDPDFVETQARMRLGWVMRGETGFKVVGEDGLPLGGGTQITSAKAPTPPLDAWWATVWGSVEAADKPAPANPEPKSQPPITERTKPRSSRFPR